MDEIRKIKESLGFDPDTPLPFEDMKYIPPPMISMKTDKELYFTPSIEDIRVGYECEIWWNQDHLPENFWDSITIDSDDYRGNTDVTSAVWYLERGELRVPYLTKEQIEKEGWKVPPNADFIGVPITKDVWKLYIEEDDYMISIEVGYETLYHGQCKDINTFRYICKLLGI